MLVRPGLAVLLLSLGARLAPAPPSERVWLPDPSRWEARLAEGEVLRVEDIGTGVTEPQRVLLRTAEGELAAVFKPIRRGRHGGFFESYEGEVAAYEIDKILGLGMVPPTIVRRIDGRVGSLQLWVEGCETYERVQDRVPEGARLSHQLSRMKMFDNLIHNDDRNAGNFLLDAEWNVVLIDHSRAFTEQTQLLRGSKKPAQYDRRLVERLRTLDEEILEATVGELLREEQIRAVLARRDGLLAHLEALVASRGERSVLFP